MGKIGDLWVRLGLKKQEFTAGLKDAQKETKTFSEGFAAFAKKAAAGWAAVAAAVVGVVSVIKNLAQQNQALGDAWNKMVAGMSASWDTFKTSVATMDFTHLLSNMREASRLARELYDARDALGEIGSAYDISYGQQAAEINRLRIELADATKSDKERLAAGERLLEIYRKLEVNPTRGLANVSDAEIDRVAQKLGYNLKGASDSALGIARQEVKDFFVWLGTEQGERFNAIAKKVAQTPLGIDSKAGQDFMRMAANNGLDRFGQLAVAYNKNVNDKTRNAMSEAVRAAGEQAARFDGETRRIQSQMNTIRSGMDSGAGVGGGASATQRQTDAFAEQLAIIKQESAELAEIRAADEAIAAETNAAYEAWREAANLPPIKPFDDETTAIMERNLLLMQQTEEEEERLRKKSEELSKAIAEQLVSAIEDGLVGAFDALADVLGGVSEGGMENVAKALLEPLADMAIKAGTLIMMSGEAIEALKSSLIGFFGGNAVFAGAALVAVGIAAKAGLAAIGNKGAGASSVSTYGTAGSDYGAGGVQTAELTVHVVGEVQGSSIILSGQNTLNEWGK